MFSVPAGLLTTPGSPFYSTSYDFVSGRVVTLYVNDLPSSTYLGISSDEIPSTHDTTITFKVTSNITLTAQFLPYEIYDLAFTKFGPNKIIFESQPTESIKADLLTTSVTGEFVAGEYVEIEKIPTAGSKVLYYRAEPLSEANINRYYAGKGIQLGATYVDIPEGRSTALILTNNSLKITNPQLGAPYAQSTLYNKPTGLSIDYGNIDIDAMNENRSISAFII
jgi:hypothetical protein